MCVCVLTIVQVDDMTHLCPTLISACYLPGEVSDTLRDSSGRTHAAGGDAGEEVISVMQLERSSSGNDVGHVAQIIEGVVGRT